MKNGEDIVSQWSLAPIQCRKESLIWLRKKFYVVQIARLWHSMTVKTALLWKGLIVFLFYYEEHDYETAQLGKGPRARFLSGEASLLWGPSPASSSGLVWFAPLVVCSTLHQSTSLCYWSGLDWSDLLQKKLFSFSQQNAVFCPPVLSEPEERWLICHQPCPWLVMLTQMRTPNPCS